MNLYELAKEMIGFVPAQFEFIYAVGTFILFICLVLLILSPVIIVYGVCKR